MNPSHILGVHFDLVDYDAVLSAVARWRGAGERRSVVLSNPHSVLMCRRDPAMGEATAGASLVLPDGVGIVWAARLLGLPHQGRVTGPELMLRLCEAGRAWDCRHYFYGGAEGVAQALAARMAELFPGLEVAGTWTPPFRPLMQEEDAEDVARINAGRPDVVWIGLGAPKQEKWMAVHLGRIEAAALIGVGAAFDYHTGRVRWAPDWVRRAGLEWAYRLAHQPGRLWRRNLDSPVFLGKVVWEKVGRRKI